MIETFGVASLAADSGSMDITLGVPVPAGSLILVACANGIQNNNFNVSDSAGNLYGGLSSIAIGGNSRNGNTYLFYAWNSKALAVGDKILCGPTANPRSISVFYATGVDASADPLVGFFGMAAGNSTNPSGTLTGVPVDALVVASLATAGPGSDAFTQDANFSAPFDRAGTGHEHLAVTIAGGHAVGMSTYAPTISKAAWTVLMAAFRAA